MNELVPALKETLFAPTYELVAEYAEIGIDIIAFFWQTNNITESRK